MPRRCQVLGPKKGAVGFSGFTELVISTATAEVIAAEFWIVLSYIVIFIKVLDVLRVLFLWALVRG